MKIRMFLMTLFVLSGFSQASAICMPIINPTLQAVIAFGNPIEVQDDPGRPADTGEHGDHNTESDSGSDAGGGGSVDPPPPFPNCKAKQCTIVIRGQENSCICCRSGVKGSISCLECGTYECGG